MSGTFHAILRLYGIEAEVIEYTDSLFDATVTAVYRDGLFFERNREFQSCFGKSLFYSCHAMRTVHCLHFKYSHFYFLSAFRQLNFFQYIYQLVYAAVIALAKVVRHAGFHMACYHLAHKGFKRTFGGAGLREHINAVGVIVNHIAKSADLPLYTAETVLQRTVLLGCALLFPCATGAYFFFTHNFLPLRRRALHTTQTEESDIASPAIMGLSRGPPKA